MRALVATDGSPASLEAAAQARRLLAAGTEIVLVTVVPPPSHPNDDATGFAGPVLTEEETASLHTEEVVDGHGALAATARSLGPYPFEQHVLEGNPGPMICDFAEEIGADVVVVGSHNKGFLARAALGSVSSYVVGHSRRPVLVLGSAPER